MTELIENIRMWFIQNCDSFLMWVQSIDLAGLFVMFAAVIKQFIATKANTSNVKDLQKALKENGKVITAMKELEAKNAELMQVVETQNAKITDLEDGIDKVLSKMNAALDVYSLVYQTIKNEDTRVAVNNILTNARYNETETRRALTANMEDMKTTVEQFMKDTTAKVEDVIAHSKILLNGSTTDPAPVASPIPAPQRIEHIEPVIIKEHSNSVPRG